MTLNVQFGNYTLIEEIGSGGFGKVYKAKDNIDRIVAIKILNPGYGDDPASIERFRREAQAAGKLFHENIATIMEFGEHEGRFYIVMRYIEGISLDRLIKEKGAIPWDQAMEIMNDIGAALDHAHQRGFVHRDIKPANILISEQEGAVLTDFGLVRAAESVGLTTSGVTMGTPNYIAPEVWEGEATSPATDEYSLACVLVEMLTGKKLFDGESTPKIMKQHMLEGPRLPDQWPAGVPEYAAPIIKMGLAAKQNQRYHSVSEFISALETGFDQDNGIPEAGMKNVSLDKAPGLDKKKNRPFRWLMGCSILFAFMLLIAGGVLLRSVLFGRGTADIYTVAKIPEIFETDSTQNEKPTIIDSSNNMPKMLKTALPTNTNNSMQEVAENPSEIPGIRVEVGQTISDVVDEDTNPLDVYGIELFAGEEYNFSLGCQNNCGWVFLELANPDSSSFEFDQWSKSLEMRDSGYGPTHQVFTPAVSGTYYIAITTNDSAIKYSLVINRTSSITGSSLVSDIPGMPLTIGKNITDVVDENTNPRDVYAVELIAGEEYNISLGCQNNCGWVFLELANPDSSSFEFDQWSESIEMRDSGYGPTQQIYNVAVSGTYYIAVTTNDSGIKYSLSINRTSSVTSPGEVSDIPGMPLNVGEEIIGVVDEYTNPRDVYSIELTPGHDYGIAIECMNNCGWVFLELANPDSRSFEYDQWSESIIMKDSGYGPTQQVFSPSVSGRYYISVSTNNPSIKYFLKVTLIK